MGVVSLGSLTVLLLAIPEPSRWSKRTAKRRSKTEGILSQISLPSLTDHGSSVAAALDLQTEWNAPILAAPKVDWHTVDPIYDPQKGGRLREDSSRAQRKRMQVETFAYVVSQLLQCDEQERTTIVDAGSGAGNLAVALVGLIPEWLGSVCAMDVNEMALARLSERMVSRSGGPRITTLCADLADATLPPDTAVVCSLHACGAATDMAIRLATSRRIPFCVSPCCTAKAVTRRQHSYGLAASAQRSGAPTDIIYPRSQWLRSNLEKICHDLLPEDCYELLAKVADVGLGPQTPLEQRSHQRLAKHTVELDRLMGVQERHGYHVRLMRLRGHEGYAKAELLLGAPHGSSAAKAIASLPVLM